MLMFDYRRVYYPRSLGVSQPLVFQSMPIIYFSNNIWWSRPIFGLSPSKHLSSVQRCSERLIVLPILLRMITIIAIRESRSESDFSWPKFCGYFPENCALRRSFSFPKLENPWKSTHGFMGKSAINGRFYGNIHYKWAMESIGNILCHPGGSALATLQQPNINSVGPVAGKIYMIHLEWHILVGGDWNMTCIFFHSVGNGTIIPIDELIFFRGVAKPATSIS